MARINQFISQLLRDEEGATMVEYALMVALIAAVAVVGVTTLGTKANTTFSGAAGKMP